MVGEGRPSTSSLALISEDVDSGPSPAMTGNAEPERQPFPPSVSHAHCHRSPHSDPRPKGCLAKPTVFGRHNAAARVGPRLSRNCDRVQNEAKCGSSFRSRASRPFVRVRQGVAMQAASALVTALGRQWKRAAYPLQVACLVLPALLLVGLAWIDYQVELERTRNDVATTTNALAEHAQTVMETVELVLARVLDHIDRQDWATIAASPERRMSSWPVCGAHCRRSRRCS
jgi:hypothetical protein